MNKGSKGWVWAAMGFELTGLVVAAIYLGLFIDDYLLTPGMFVSGFCVLAFVFWLLQVIKMTKITNSKELND